MEEQSRYIIGIDLGTTNSCVAYVDTNIKENPALATKLFHVPQLTTEGVIEAKKTLPSFYYFAGDDEFPNAALDMPWAKGRHYVVGSFARDHGCKVPTRLVLSAKSWLCHHAVKRTDKILPCDASDSRLRLSPVEATAAYLQHIKDAWNSCIAKGDSDKEFNLQEIALTVPASFDEVARSLTVEAAKMAGYKHMSLLEEPQAAFYNWIDSKLGKEFDANADIVVCDVGGGTTDFSYIRIEKKEDGSIAFQRKAVGRHLLLGGDNMDAAIAHYLEAKLEDVELDPEQWQQLRHRSREAKEHLLEEGETFQVVIQGKGSSLIKGSLQVAITRDELVKLLSEGFWGQYSKEEALNLKRASAVRSMGLPYESDPSITKHLAHFLQNAMPCKKERFLTPDYILFNGGSMKPALFQGAITQALKVWGGGKETKILSSTSLDYAVARGAAYFGKVRRGLGVRIGGGLPRNYYLLVDDTKGKKKALTVLPKGSEEGTRYISESPFTLKANTPVLFNIVTSHTRLNDKVGDAIALNDEDFSMLPALETELRFGKKKRNEERKVEVLLEAFFNELGVLELKLKSVETDHQWNLNFQIRNASGQDDNLQALEQGGRDEIFAKEELEEAVETIKDTFVKGSKKELSQIITVLEGKIGQSKDEWSPSLIRNLWGMVYQQASLRNTSQEHESRWWQLTGYLLRPGFGHSLDDFRLKDLWKVILGDYKTPKGHDCSIARWVCYRRIAGGLSKGQQIQVSGEIIATLFDKNKRKLNDRKKFNPYEYDEMLRTLASLEFLDINLKKLMGKALLDKIIKKGGSPCEYWALGRIGSRQLVYGGLAQVLPRQDCEGWVESLIKTQDLNNESLVLCLGMLARKTDLREINLSTTIVDKALKVFANSQYDERLKRLLKDKTLNKQEQESIVGDSLPAGLTLPFD
jgi:actin-like ATPase involved in cell morphogenesis